MPYRRFPAVYRRYGHWLPDLPDDNNPEPGGSIEVEKVNKAEEFPLPNMTESLPVDDKSRKGSLPGLLNSVLSRITIEELVLLGVIIILFDGGVQDEILLIMLIYILLT